MNDKNYCIGCGKELPNRRMQPHCLTEECNNAWAAYFVRQKIRQEGECQIWEGSIKRGVAWFSIVVGRKTPAGERKDYRVIDFLTAQAGRDVHRYHNYKNLCGTPKCVNIDHNRANVRPPSTPSMALNGKLNPQPILDKAYNFRRPIPQQMRKNLEKAKERGYITVGMVDTICIDFLGIHPYELYGEEFFTA